MSSTCETSRKHWFTAASINLQLIHSMLILIILGSHLNQSQMQWLCWNVLFNSYWNLTLSGKSLLTARQHARLGESASDLCANPPCYSWQRSDHDDTSCVESPEFWPQSLCNRGDLCRQGMSSPEGSHLPKSGCFCCRQGASPCALASLCQDPFLCQTMDIMACLMGVFSFRFRGVQWRTTWISVGTLPFSCLPQGCSDASSGDIVINLFIIACELIVMLWRILIHLWHGATYFDAKIAHGSSDLLKSTVITVSSQCPRYERPPFLTTKCHS